MVSSVPSDKAHQAGLVDTIGLQVVYSGAFGSTSQVSAERGSCTRPATADQEKWEGMRAWLRMLNLTNSSINEQRQHRSL